ncbi:tetratricopeptide repeat protein, partial [Caballeronia sp. GAFFF2]|uniref:tetratricopeptide repeat protein n=1 Tax=Caballeronia sp. GAFFF2 TaxID=2921741 RepID=UPI002028839A
ALASDQKRLPLDHPDIALRQSNLSIVLRRLGEVAEARSLLELAYDSLLRKFGPEHPDTRLVKGNLDDLP